MHIEIYNKNDDKKLFLGLKPNDNVSLLIKNMKFLQTDMVRIDDKTFSIEELTNCEEKILKDL